jgi:dihydroorotate dehydrogenase (NAD+) catalytic subunit
MTFLDLPFSSPVTNASGMLGFNPAPRAADLSHLGGFITNPVSLAPRTAAAGIRLVRFPGGVLLHSGLPNPGLRKVLTENGNKWARSGLPVIVHLIAAHPDELFSMVRRLEETDGVAGLEVGLEAGIRDVLARALVQAAVGELPVLVRPALEDVPRLAGEAADAGASALTIGPPRGSLPGPDGSIISGRIYGPAVRPLALEALKQVVGMGIPVIYSGGIRNQEEIETTLALGAAGVQIDIALWNSGGLKIRAGSSSAPG